MNRADELRRLMREANATLNRLTREYWTAPGPRPGSAPDDARDLKRRTEIMRARDGYERLAQELRALEAAAVEQKVLGGLFPAPAGESSPPGPGWCRPAQPLVAPLAEAPAPVARRDDSQLELFRVSA